MPIIGKKRLSVDFNVRSTRDVRRRKENVSLIVKCSEPPSGSANASYEPAAAIVPHDESQTTNSRLRDAQEEHWCRVREEMTAVGLSLEFPHSFNCSACGIGVQFPIRCQDCSPAFICCVSCESKMHQQTLHKPELWKVTSL